MLNVLLLVLGLLSILVLAVLIGVAQSLAKWFVEGELKGAFFDYLDARVRRAAAQLPARIAADMESEWLEELAACRDRPRMALRLVRGLPAAAAAIHADATDAAPEVSTDLESSSRNNAMKDTSSMAVPELLHEAFAWIELLQAAPPDGWPPALLAEQRYLLEQLRGDYVSGALDYDDGLARLRNYCVRQRMRHGGRLPDSASPGR